MVRIMGKLLLRTLNRREGILVLSHTLYMYMYHIKNYTRTIYSVCFGMFRKIARVQKTINTLILKEKTSYMQSRRSQFYKTKMTRAPTEVNHWPFQCGSSFVVVCCLYLTSVVCFLHLKIVRNILMLKR